MNTKDQIIQRVYSAPIGLAPRAVQIVEHAVPREVRNTAEYKDWVTKMKAAVNDHVKAIHISGDNVMEGDPVIPAHYELTGKGVMSAACGHFNAETHKFNLGAGLEGVEAGSVKDQVASRVAQAEQAEHLFTEAELRKAFKGFLDMLVEENGNDREAMYKYHISKLVGKPYSQVSRLMPRGRAGSEYQAQMLHDIREDLKGIASGKTQADAAAVEVADPSTVIEPGYSPAILKFQEWLNDHSHDLGVKTDEVDGTTTFFLFHGHVGYCGYYSAEAGGCYDASMDEGRPRAELDTLLEPKTEEALQISSVASLLAYIDETMPDQ